MKWTRLDEQRPPAKLKYPLTSTILRYHAAKHGIYPDCSGQVIIGNTFDDVVWLNPTGERHWDYTPSIEVMRQLVGDRMYPLTIEGLEKAMKELSK